MKAIATFVLALCFLSLRVSAQTDSFDLTFNSGIGFIGDVMCLKLQPDGKIIAGGDFISYNGVDRNGIIRLHPDGAIDTSFHPTGTATTYLSGNNPVVTTCQILSNGKILIGGLFDSVNGVSRVNVARLNSDGSTDMTFDPGLILQGAGNKVFALAPMPDGKVFVGGAFSLSGSFDYTNLVLLNGNGTMDNGFTVGSGFDNTVEALAVLPTGKVMVGGSFARYAGNASNSLIILDTTGAQDASFNAPSVISVIDFAIRADGKIVTVGHQVHRINADGSADPTFVIGSGFGNSTHNVTLQPDGKILVGGYLTDYQGHGIGSMVRINSDGSFDNTFNLHNGFDQGGTYCFALQPDGRILVGGNFYYFNNSHYSSRIARLKNKIGTTTGVTDEPGDAYAIDIYPNPAADAFTISLSSRSQLPLSADVYDLSGRQVRSLFSDTGISGVYTGRFTVDGLAAGAYMVRISCAGAAIASRRLIIE